MSGAPRASSVDVILRQAREREKEYDWLGAARLHQKALGLSPDTDFLKRGQVQENVGYALYRAAMQAENLPEFKDRMLGALESYEKAHGFYERLTDGTKVARLFRCSAVASYLGFWLTSDPAEQRQLLDECLEQEAQALQAFSEAGDMLEYGRTYGALPLRFWLRIRLEWSGPVRKLVSRRGVEWGKTAVVALAAEEASSTLAQACYTLGECLGGMNAFIAEPEEQDRNFSTIVEYLRRAVDHAARTSNTLLVGLATLNLAACMSPEESREKAKEVLRLGETTRDVRLIAWSLSFLANWASMKAEAEVNLAKREELMGEAVQFYDRAHRLYSAVPIPSLCLGFMDFPHGWIFYYLYKYRSEVVLEERLDALKKAEEAGAEALRVAESSDSPEYIETTLAITGTIQLYRAESETHLSEKRRHLEMSLNSKERVHRIREETTPFAFQSRAVGLMTFAVRKMYLADIEPDSKKQRKLLEETSASMEKGLALWAEAFPGIEKREQLPSLAVVLHRDQCSYIALLMRLYHATKKSEHLRKAIAISGKAIDSAKKFDHTNLVAESHWRIARAQGLLQEHLQSAESFKRASEGYRKSAEKVPQLRSFYQEYAVYMEAWSDIQNAKHYHERQEFSLAGEHYERAATLHKSLRQWSYLAPNYSAWAQVEEAEALSISEHSKDAMQAFENAARLFAETRKSLHARLDKIEDVDERQIATNVLKATGFRQEYCLGRILLEEAKIFERKGDHQSSSRRYGSAAETFRQATRALESEQDKKEFQLIITLSRAWQKMMLAEARASAELYTEASKLFEQASQQSDSERTSFLTLGHSRFCKALEAGTQFADTRDAAMHAVAIQHLESAANYYVKAGFQKASEYARATDLLLDAYLYMDDAKKERDPKKKDKLYALAQLVLQTSASSFKKAEHPEKREQVLRLLERVKEERELVISLAEILQAPAIVSSASAFLTPYPTYENAFGSEKFQHAEIHANLTALQRELIIGDSLTIEIGLVNAGKTPALLTKIEELIPEGFELTEKPEMYHVENGGLHMKGKRLDPMRSEEMKLVLKPRAKGEFLLKPKILYLDDGKYRTHEPEPITISVKELGIRSWIKGEA